MGCLLQYLTVYKSLVHCEVDNDFAIVTWKNGTIAGHAPWQITSSCCHFLQVACIWWQEIMKWQNLGNGLWMRLAALHTHSIGCKNIWLFAYGSNWLCIHVWYARYSRWCSPWSVLVIANYHVWTETVFAWRKQSSERQWVVSLWLH